jgi:acyl dehydratase
MATELDIPQVGFSLPPMHRTIDLPVMVAYAGATWDWHRLHYDTAYIAARNLPAPVVDGQLLGAYLATHLTDHLGPRASIVTMEFRFKSMVFAGETVSCHTVVTSVTDSEAGSVIRLDQKVTVAERVAVSPATAEVLLAG